MLCLVTAIKCFVCKLQPSGFNLLSADTHIRCDGPGRRSKAAGSGAASWEPELVVWIPEPSRRRSRGQGLMQGTPEGLMSGLHT